MPAPPGAGDPAETLRFGPFELRAAQGELRRAGEVVPLQDLPFRLLLLLARRAPAVLSREELAAQLWPPGTHLEVDASLNTAVARVREALGDAASAPTFVATVPRRGYRLLVPVQAAAPPRARRARYLAVGGLCLALLVALLLGWRQTGLQRPATVPDPNRAEAQGAAREHLLIGRHQADRRSREGLEKAIASFQRAAALAPENAEAYSGMAASYALLGIYDYWRPREAFGPAETFARRALELDDSSAKAHLAMGLVDVVAHWDWQGAEQEMRRAVALGPEAADTWYWRGALLAARGRHDEAIASTEKALSLSPASPVINAALAWRLFQARRGEEAVAQAHRALELDDTSFDAWDNLKWIEITLGHEAEAALAWRRAEQIDNGGGEDIASNFRQGGLTLLHQLSVKSQVGRWETGAYQSPYDIVLEYCALGEADNALLWLERSFAERETDLADLAVDPRVDLLRSDARFQQILRQIHLPLAARSR